MKILINIAVALFIVFACIEPETLKGTVINGFGIITCLLVAVFAQRYTQHQKIEKEL